MTKEEPPVLQTVLANAIRDYTSSCTAAHSDEAVISFGIGLLDELRKEWELPPIRYGNDLPENLPEASAAPDVFYPHHVAKLILDTAATVSLLPMEAAAQKDSNE